MPRISVTRRDGSVREVDARPSLTLMEVLRDEDLDIEALCGGCCSCATCHVYIEPDCSEWLPPLGEDEDLLLEDSTNRRLDASRLSCQIRVTDQMEGLRLTVAPAD